MRGERHSRDARECVFNLGEAPRPGVGEHIEEHLQPLSDDSRIIDLSRAAAKKVGVYGPGTAKVEVVALGSILAGLTGRGKTEAVVVVREGARTMDLATGLALIRRQAFSSVRVVE